MIPRALALGLFVVTLTAAAADDFSARLDALWNFNDPAASEARFRAERARHAAASREALETETQVARTQSLRRQFAAAHATLDAIEPGLAAVDARVRVRYLLERGRTFNSSDAPEKAVPLFADAAARSAALGRAGDEFYTVDALHMLGIAAPPDARLGWNLKALAAADAASDSRARNWRGSLLNNLGWTYFDTGDAATALDYWKRALAFRQEAGDAVRIREAKWAVARGLRAQGQLDEAAAMQIALVKEFDAIGEKDGYVFEELAEIAVARGDRAAAAPWAAKAYAALKDDGGLQASEPARLKRLAALGNVAP